MTSPATVDIQPAKLVKCPTCGGSSVYALSNAFRPFCCERCKQIDLGAWASERFAVPATVSLEDQLIDKN
jgi:endogenous inhibitor of DNA gyrase (YacG/DUF329 family)